MSTGPVTDTPRPKSGLWAFMIVPLVLLGVLLAYLGECQD